MDLAWVLVGPPLHQVGPRLTRHGACRLKSFVAEGRFKKIELLSGHDQHNCIDKFYKEHEPWPLPTLNRYHTFLSQEEFLLTQDYLFYADVDMLFLDYIEDEILSKRVATIHPGFPLGACQVESNENSTAYIPTGSNEYYFQKNQI